MEFDFNVNAILADGINEINRTMMPCRNGVDRSLLRRQLFEIVDKMGVASAQAQGLHGAITSGRKMELSDHKLYIMKDQEGQRGNGSIVGILKIGRKKLFVYDLQGRQHEMEPMCVLDFYVHESRQRTGCGKSLFQYMLQRENIRPCHLAIDRPSHKFSQFLQKHYNLRNQIPQTNNFVVYEGFLNQNDCRVDKRRNGTRIYNGYLTNGSAGSDQRNGLNNNYTNYYGNRPPSGSRYSRPPSGQTQRNQSQIENLPNSVNIGSRRPSGQLENLPNPYRNYGPSEPNQNQAESVPNPLNNCSRPSSGRALPGSRSRPSSGRLLNRPPSGKTSEEIKIIQEQNNQAIKELNINPRSNTMLTQRTNSPQQSSHLDPAAYSRYNPQLLHKPPSPLHHNNSRERIDSLTDKIPQHISSNQINLHQDYQGRGGHLRINPVTGNVETRFPKINSADKNNRTPAMNAHVSTWKPSAKPESDTISWTIGSCDNYHNQPNRRNQQFRFW